MASPSMFATLARIGLAGRGLMYLSIGGISMAAGRATEPAALLGSLSGGTWGRVALAVLAIGLFAFGLWRLVEAFLDLEGAGEGLKGKAVRFAHVLSGIAHLGLGLYAASLVPGNRPSQATDSAQTAASVTLDLPGGQMLLGLIAAGLLAGSFFQFVSAWRLTYLKQLRGSARSAGWVKWIGRLGYVARGIVFGLIGLFFLKAARTAHSSDAGGMAKALDSLDPNQFILVAAGLALFGLFALVEARYRCDPGQEH